jgi:hypothetical protein
MKRQAISCVTEICCRLSLPLKNWKCAASQHLVKELQIPISSTV